MSVVLYKFLFDNGRNEWRGTKVGRYTAASELSDSSDDCFPSAILDDNFRKGV